VKSKIVLSLLAGALLTAGCGTPFPSLELELLLPPLPEDWEAAFPEVCYELAYVDARGQAVRTGASPWVAGAPGTPLLLPARAYSPVVVTPVVPSLGVRLRPAGALSPLDVEPGSRRLAASWERGTLALVVRTLLGEGASSIPPEALDVERLAREVAARGDGDPWRVDVEALIASVVESAGSGWECRRLATRQVVIPDAEATEYVWDNALRAAAVCLDDDEGGRSLVLEAVPLGLHRLFPRVLLTSAPQWLDLCVTPTEAAWVRRSPDP
jgi:hypothetical protein